MNLTIHNIRPDLFCIRAYGNGAIYQHFYEVDSKKDAEMLHWHAVTVQHVNKLDLDNPKVWTLVARCY